MSVVVTTSKFCGGYISSFIGTISPDGGQLVVTVFDSPNDGVVTSPPAMGSVQNFNFNEQFKFEGIVKNIAPRSETASAPKSYAFTLSCTDIISNYSDDIAGLPIYNIGVTFTAKVMGPTADQRPALLLSIGAFIDIKAYVYGANPPNSNYGSTFDWRIYPISDAFFLNDVIYRSYVAHSENAPNGSPMYMIDGKIPQSSEGISISPKIANPPATTNPNTDTSPPITIVTPPAAGSTVGSSTTTQTNDYGAGSVIIKYPNNGTVPVGTTVTTSSSDGLTSTKTIYANSSEVTETTLTTFSPTRNVASQNIAQKQQAFNQPASFQGSIDPTLLFPSVQIYPSSTYIAKESGKFFGKSISPTSFDLDPYFYFSKNDYGLVAKDGKSNSKNINTKKEPVKDHVRTMGLKGPMYYSGWGYDVQGLPVPNASGLNSSGIYAFHPNAPVERKLWKTGPVDLRWHDKRKVWVGGNEILEGYLDEDLKAPSKANDPTKARMQVMRTDMTNSTSEYIWVTNRDKSLTASKGAYIMVIDINYQWRPIWVECS
jgi:hypothetical protein